jgi:MFS-type transporter involved in bile tolerance (Atg22 family)
MTLLLTDILTEAQSMKRSSYLLYIGSETVNDALGIYYISGNRGKEAAEILTKLISALLCNSDFMSRLSLSI